MQMKINLITLKFPYGISNQHIAIKLLKKMRISIKILLMILLKFLRKSKK